MKKFLLIITLSLGLANCASITGENYQPINLTAKDDKSNSVEGANCVLVNEILNQYLETYNL